LVGNFKLMNKFGIQYDLDPNSIVYTTIAVAYDNKFVGYITIADSIKEDAEKTIRLLHKVNVKATMLSGDKSTVVKYVAEQLGIDNAFGDLLPEDKVNRVKEIKAKGESVAFVGDGVNDAPVVALSDVGKRQMWSYKTISRAKSQWQSILEKRQRKSFGKISHWHLW